MTIKISRGTGTTDSERYLARLADNTFLDIWAYPNTYKSDGKEHADLLIVCGDDIIIFSDKGEVLWRDHNDPNVAWRRWFTRAVLESAKQLWGAERWLRHFPHRLFTDPTLQHPLPVVLPPPDRMRVHLVAVTRGTKEACVKFFGGGSGALAIMPAITGDTHTNPSAPGYHPFAVGDIDPGGTFVHVLDEVTLDVVMSELDTITDFARYLRKKEAFIRSGALHLADGEEDLLAVYLMHMNRQGEHDFVKVDHTAWTPVDQARVPPGHYRNLRLNAAYAARVAANEPSYVWDRLIRIFTKELLDGTGEAPPGVEYRIEEAEFALRQMAIIERYKRRGLGQSLLEVLQKGPDHERYARIALVGRDDVGFAFLTLKYPKLELPGGYDQYRQARRLMMRAYGLSTLRRHPELRLIVVIATEPKAKPGELSAHPRT